MNSTTYKRKLEIYEELQGLLTLKRKHKGNNLLSFVRIYLTSLTEYNRPPFHVDILESIQASVAPSVTPPITESPTKSAKYHPMEHHSRTATAQLPQDTIQGTSTGSNTPKRIHSATKEGKDISPSINTQRMDERGTEEGMMTPPVPRSKDSYISPILNSTENSKLDTLDKTLNNRLLFIAPRGFAKSTICSRFFPLWLALYGIKKDIMLISSTVALAKDNLKIIKDQLVGNEKIIQDFGEMQSDKWTEEEIILSNGVRIRAKGRGFQIRGLRPDMIICDDLEDDEMVASKEQREKLENWFMRTLLPTLKPDQSLVYIGTKLHQFALIAKLQEKKEFKTHFYKALIDGKSIWEDMWPVTRLLQLKEELGTYAFESEYQNNPLSLTEQPIKPHYIDGVDIGGHILESCMSIDPAISERENADYTAIQVMGRTEHGFKELLTIKGRWGIEEQVDKIIDLYVQYQKRWNINRVLIEEVAFQKVLRPLIVNKSRKQQIYIPISTAELGMGDNKRPKDKRTRLMQVVHLFEGRLVEIHNNDLRQDLLAFPFGDYDDQVDVTVYNLYWLNQNHSGKFMRKKEAKGFPLKTKDAFFIEEIRPGVWMTKFEGHPQLNIVSNSKVLNYDKPNIHR